MKFSAVILSSTFLPPFFFILVELQWFECQTFSYSSQESLKLHLFVLFCFSSSIFSVVHTKWFLFFCFQVNWFFPLSPPFSCLPSVFKLITCFFLWESIIYFLSFKIYFGSLLCISFLYWHFFFFEILHFSFLKCIWNFPLKQFYDSYLKYWSHNSNITDISVWVPINCIFPSIWDLVCFLMF